MNNKEKTERGGSGKKAHIGEQDERWGRSKEKDIGKR